MDNESEAALVMLTAFIGAVFGCTGCFAATVTGNAALGAIAAGGTALCVWVWREHLILETTDAGPDVRA